MSKIKHIDLFLAEASYYGVSIEVVSKQDDLKRIGVHIAKPFEVERLADGLALALEHNLTQIFLYVPNQIA